MATGALLGLVCFGLATAMAEVFDEPKLKTLLHWFSVVPFLLALQAVPQLLIMQQMDFRIYAIRSLFSTIGSGIVGIVMALQGFGALALVAQQIVLYSLANLTLWFFIEWRPHFAFRRDIFAETLKPGLRMLLSNTLAFVEQQMPRLFLGHFLGPVSVGFYAFAFRMRFALQDVLVTPVFAVLFPALSRIKDDRAHQDEILSGVFFLIGLVIFPAVTVAIVTAPLYVPLFFGEKWVDAIPVLQLFLVLGYAAPFVKLAEVVFRVHNRVDLYLRGQIVLAGLGAIAVFFAAQKSLMVSGLVVFVFTLAGVPLYFLLLGKGANLGLWHHFRQLLKSLFSTAVTGLAVSAPEFAFRTGNAWADLLVTLATGSLVYLILTVLLQRNEIKTLLSFIRENKS